MNFMKLFAIFLAASLLSGCGWFERKFTANITGYAVICVKETKVTYVQAPSGFAPLYTLDGRLVECDNH
jgi:hypothetical protein